VGKFRHRARLSRIYFNGRYLDYPLKLPNVVSGLGLWTSFAIFLSYVRAHLKPRLPELSLEDYIVNRFGMGLFKIFFKSYTGKVWGVSCRDISADWAAQRIRGLSFYNAVKATLFPKRAGGVRTFIDSFQYPRLGSGQMWEKIAAQAKEAGNPVFNDTEALAIRHNGDHITEIVANNGGSEQECLRARDLVSSMPLRDLVERLDPPPPEVLTAARLLNNRDFLTVALIINEPALFPDNWLQGVSIFSGHEGWYAVPPKRSAPQRSLKLEIDERYLLVGDGKNFEAEQERHNGACKDPSRGFRQALKNFPFFFECCDNERHGNQPHMPPFQKPHSLRAAEHLPHNKNGVVEIRCPKEHPPQAYQYEGNRNAQRIES
jgi:hypothetical protein